MFKQFYQWYQQRFIDPNLGVLVLVLLLGVLTFYFLGSILMPLFVAVVLSYLLERPVTLLMRFKLSRNYGTLIVMTVFIFLCTFAVVGVLPILFKQLASLINDFPEMLNEAQTYLLTLPSKYPEMVDFELVTAAVNSVRTYVLSSGGYLLSYSFSSLMNIAAFVVYAILVPLMMTFLLKDKHLLMKGVSQHIPENRRLLVQVWDEMDLQILNYIRGKVIEMLIVGVATYFVFFFMDLRYAALLSVLVGISVLIPYIGAVAVTVPVMIVALFQWGVSAEFAYLMIAYLIVQALDGNLVVPLLFSEAVNLHPVIIIVAVLVFGGLWGFWGIFFAIPLASLVKALLNAWPKQPINTDVTC